MCEILEHPNEEVGLEMFHSHVSDLSPIFSQEIHNFMTYFTALYILIFLGKIVNLYRI